MDIFYSYYWKTNFSFLHEFIFQIGQQRGKIYNIFEILKSYKF